MKTLSVAAAASLLVLFLAPLSAQVLNPIAPIETNSGMIAGKVLASGVKAWYGIAYAKPPVDELRWRPPQPIHWNGVWNADRFGPECIQYLRPHTLNQYFGEEATSEDCLFLNIWAPGDAAANSKLPVVIFIHGGGSSVGSGSMPHYSGENFVKRGAVFVTFNYRLGLLGFLAHPALTAEQGGHSGDYGYLDQVAAFQWVHDNIAKFGGDPARVTIFGQSSGGISVFQHLFSPLSKGLFSAAVLSAACCGFRETSLADGEKVGLALQAALGAADLNAMRAAPADKILAQQGESQNLANHPGLHAGNIIDGYFMPHSYRDALKTHEFSQVSLLFTSNNKDNDWSHHPLANAKTVADYKSIAVKVYGEKAGEFLALYPVLKDSDVPITVAHVIEDGGLQADARDCAKMFHHRAAAHPLGTYISLYDHNERFVPGVQFADLDTAAGGAYHNADTPYWFGAFDAFNTLRPTRVFMPDDRGISSAMVDMLIAFAGTGDPSTPAVKWPAWSPANEQRLVIDHHIHAEKLYVKGMNWLAANPLVRNASLPCAAPLGG